METPTTSGSYEPASNPMLPRVEAPPSVTPSPKPASSMRVVWMVLVGAVVLAGAAYAWMMLNPASQVAMESLSPSPTATADPTAGWKTYTNAQHGFELRHPATWKAEDLGGGLNLFSSQNPYEGERLKTSVMKAQFQSAGVDNSISTKEGFIENMKKAIASDETSLASPITSTTTLQNQFGLEILKLKGGWTSTTYIIPKKSNFSEVFNVLVWNEDPLMDQILSTFKFTTPVDTSTWKTYKNTQYGFELKYPTTASVVEQGAAAGAYDVEVHYDKNNNSFEPTRLIVSNAPDSRPGLKLTNTRMFSSSTTDANGENYIHFTLNNSSIYANCLYTKEQNILDFCNQILATFKFTK